tara:strand:+ start:390 stop:581 length:192 start_codon:yes stop_codon:yes gene_type:complete
MTEEKLYKILTFNTNGWNLIEDSANNLTKDQCNALLQQFVADGYNPSKLQAVAVDDPRFQFDL